MRLIIVLVLLGVAHCLFDTKFCDPMFKKIFSTDEGELLDEFHEVDSTKIDKLRTVHYVCGFAD